MPPMLATDANTTAFVSNDSDSDTAINPNKKLIILLILQTTNLVYAATVTTLVFRHRN